MRRNFNKKLGKRSFQEGNVDWKSIQYFCQHDVNWKEDNSDEINCRKRDMELFFSSCDFNVIKIIH